MDDDETDGSATSLENTLLPYEDSANVVLTLSQVKDEIENCLKEKYSFREVVDKFEKKFNRKLSEQDSCHVEDKYIEVLTDLWLDESFNIVSRGLDPTHPLDFIEILNTVNSFSDCLVLFGTSSTHNALVSDLSEISPSFKAREKELVFELRKRCYSYILTSTNDTKNEIEFVENFFEALKSFKDVQRFCQLFHIHDFLQDKNRLQLVLTSLIDSKLFSTKFSKLKNSAKRIYHNKDYFFLEHFRDKVLAYLEPVVIKESNTDGRLLLEVSGRHIVLSKELEEIEKNPRFSHIEEVRFVGAGVMHIDADLSNSFWHGKNIVVYGETLIVSEEKCVVWNVSGKDADFTAENEPGGTSADGCGLKGKDGNPGESGGNVFILVESIENVKNFNIVSKGGSGSNGQNGGQGKDGEDGAYIDEYNFKNDYPPVSHLLKKPVNYMKTMESVCKNVLSVDKLHYGFNEFEISVTEFISIVKQNTDLKNIYFEITTKEGCKIKFSFYNEGLLTCCQSFLLHKGASGMEGKAGGTGGCGGQGGFAGDINVLTSKSNSTFVPESPENGADGVLGKSGRRGNPGKCGLDRGYMDCTWSLYNVFSRDKWPKIFIPGPGDNNRLTETYYLENKSSRVKCPLNCLYAEITPIRKPFCMYSTSERTDHDVAQKHGHQEIHAKRKKTISQRSIVEQYKEKNSLWNMKNIENALEQVQREMKFINETSKESEKITQEAKITRQISYCQSEWYQEEIKHDTKLETKKSLEDIEDKTPLMYSIQSNKRNSLSVKNFGSNVADSVMSVMSTNSFEPSSKVSENISLKKHHLDILKHINDFISLDHIVEKNTNIKSQSVNTRFLAEVHSTDSIFDEEPSHPVEKFFRQDSTINRQELVRICDDYTLNDGPLHEAFDSFISEFDNGCRNETISELGKRSIDFNRLKEHRLKEKILPLKNELLKQVNKNNLYNYLLKGVLKQSTESKLQFENEISQDKFVSYLYSSFVFERKKICDWEIENFDTHVLPMFHQYMIDKGPFATSFRELLAQHFDVNILLYRASNNESNKFVLVSNHNPKARSYVHLLLKRNKFVKLNFHLEFVRLFEKYEHLGNVLDKIMFHLCSFTDKQQISDYISKAPFNSDDYSGLSSSDCVGIKINHILNEEIYVNTVANSYMSEDDKIWVKCRLEKLKAEFIGYANILHHMALHFEVEGSQIPSTELCFIINQILKFALEDSKVMSLVSWIIAFQAQQFWVVELALLKLELYMKSPLKHETKFKWREYIDDQREKERLIMFLKKLDCETDQMSVEGLDELLHLMSSIPKAHIGLENVNISEWKYHLKDRFWAHQMTNITDWSEEQLKTLSFYLVTWENSIGVELCMYLVGILKEHSNEMKTEQEKNLILAILRDLNRKEDCFSAELWNKLNNCTVKEWQKVIDNKSMNSTSDRTLQQLVMLIQNSGNTSKNVLEILPGVESAIKDTNQIGNSLKKDVSEKKLKGLFLDILNSNKNESSMLFKIKSFFAEILPDESTFVKTLEVLQTILIPSTQGFSFKNFTKSPSSNLKEVQSSDEYLNRNSLYTKNMFLPLVELCIGLKHNKWLRNTQKLTVMTLLTNAKNTLVQVSTGEGKSLIVVTVAIIKALSGEKVNIVTSSKVLAKRDADIYKNIYELCGLTVGHNCWENIEERKKVYSNCQVIYGDLANFQRDFLLDRVYNKNILGNCSFETVIIDEVDSMLLDKGNNVLYLSHDIPGLDKVEPVLMYIWKWVSRPISSGQVEDVFNVQVIKEKIMYELFGVINKENLKQLDISMTEKQVNKTWEYLIDNEVINRNGKVLKESVNCCNLHNLPESCIPKMHLQYILEKVINREKILNVPKYLHTFVEDHLEGWIKSGVSAMVMENGRDYIVDVDRTGTVSDRDPIITILDRDTGTDLVNSQWDEALHQFLQLKHGCKLSLLNLKAVFKSNVSYLKLYKTLYGLTGTLGSNCERELLQKVYDVDFVTIPTAKAKKFSEEPSILCVTTEDWKKNIVKEVCKITSKKRSALIICETIKEVSVLKEMFTPHFRPECIHIYIRDYESLSVDVADNLLPGNVIISTNLSGRGTDIKLSKQLIANGGLYVCLTFLPSNFRVEEQAYGRVARNGEPGSAQLIFRNMRPSASSTYTQIIDYKKQRDIKELKRLADIKSHHDNQIHQEEKWFEKFREVYKNLNKMKQDENVKNILIQTFLNQWAFWLDRNKKRVFVSNLQDICNSLEHFISDWADLGSGDLDSWLKLVEDPAQLVKLGLIYLKNKKFPSSQRLFDKVIEEEPYFSEIAHYYRVCARTEQNDLDIIEILKTMNLTARKLKERAESIEISALEINWLKEQDKVNLIQMDSFLDQQKNRSKIYKVFLRSIYSAVGNDIFPELFIIPGIVEKHMAKDIYNNLMNEGLLTKPKIKSNIKIEDLLFVKNYGLSPNKMNLFLSDFQGKEYIEQPFLRSFEEKCVLPSREAFWVELVNNQALNNEENFYFINMQELQAFHPYLCHQLQTKRADKCSMQKIRLYEPDELVQTNSSESLVFITQDELIQLIGPDMCQFLEKKDMIFSNKCAVFDSTKALIFDHFDAITKEDFETVNIFEETASKIMEDLINQNVIKEKSSSVQPGLYNLMIDAENVEQIELTSHKAYTYEVRSLMSVCFAFRIAFEKLKLLSMTNCERVCLPLPFKLHNKIVLELKEKEIIEKTYVEVKKNVSTTLDILYPKKMSKDEYKNLLKQVSCNLNLDSMIDILISNKWLIQENQVYYINSNIKSIYSKTEKSPNTQLPKPQPLTVLNSNDPKDTIGVTILNHLLLIEHLDNVKQVITSSRGEYLELETPNFSLRPLLDVLLEERLSSEIDVFTLNGFDHLIVLKEKEWTWKTMTKITGILVFGVCQVAVGVMLETLFFANPLGSMCFVGGMHDIIYGVNCLFSGHCSLKNFFLHKAISMATSILPQMSALYKSGFGQKLSGMSFKFIKEGLQKIFIKETVNTVVKNTSVKVVTAISQGLIYGFVDHFIELELEKISCTITEAIYYDINETINNHSIISCMKEVYTKYGPDDSKITLSACFSKNLCNHQELIKDSLSSSVILILDCSRQILKRFQSNSNKATTSFDYLEVIHLCFEIKKVLTENSLFQSLKTKINYFLDDVEEDLRISLIEEQTSLQRVPEKELNLFTLSVCDDWNAKIKHQLSNILMKDMISPVLQLVSNYLVDSSSKFILRKSKTVSYMNNVSKHNVQKYKVAQAKKKPKSNNKSSGESEYEKCLLDLLRKQRNVFVFTEIMRKNISVDTNFLEMCCFILPKALKNEGFVLPNFEIIIERNGTYQRFSTTNEKCEKTTIIIAPDSDIVTNFFNNKLLVENGVDLILTKICQDNPALNGYPIEQLRNVMAQIIQKAFREQPHLPTIHSELSFTKNYFKINTAVECKSPCQHFHIDGRYTFNKKLDLDLREEKEFFSLNLIEDQISKGFTYALNKINDHIHKFQEHLLHFRLSLEDFEGSNYEIVPQTNKSIKGNFNSLATHYKLVMPFVVDNKWKRLEDFIITMSLNIKKREKTLHSPDGPHITYEVSPNVHFKYLKKGVKGYVLMNKECSEYSFSVENCHVAGDLILPTGFELQKTCRVVMLGDSMFEAVHEVTSFPDFVAKSYSSLTDLKISIPDLTNFYKGIHCVVIIPGISTSMCKLSGGEITSNIAEVVKIIQVKFMKAKIVVCSLLKAKGLSTGKITQTNKCLKRQCSIMNSNFLDINSFISSNELEDNGIHLNRYGLIKIQQNLP